METLRASRSFARALLLACCALAGGGACGDSQSDTTLDDALGDGGALDGPQPRDDEHVPPIADRRALTAWLAKFYYRAWTCEPAARATLAPVHARIRVCRNDTLMDPPRDGDYHVGAAAIAELLDAADATTGLALAVRGLPDEGATGWYFYERQASVTAPLALATPLEADGTVADGYGNTGGNAQAVCAGCHAGAARDFVYGPGDVAP